MELSAQSLSEQFIKEMKTKGYSRSIVGTARHVLAAIIQRHKDCGLSNLSEAVIREYVEEQRKRFENGYIGHNRLNQLLSISTRILAFQKTGEICPVRKFLGSGLPMFFRDIVHQLRSNELFSETECTHIASCANLFFKWLLENGHHDLSKVSAETLRQYMLFISAHYNGNSMRRLQTNLKRIFSYLQKEHLVSFEFEKILSIPIAVDKKIYPAISPIDLNQILERIDRATSIGKRNYAIIVLGMVTGLRACDVAALKFSAIDWVNGTINLIQSKTMKPLVLPLTSDVGKALEDYILHGRPNVSKDQIFLNAVAPYDGISSGAASRALTNHRRAVSLPPKMGFHSLRRAVGKNMVVSGIPVTTIAQILGHSDLNSTKQYISLDSVHLKQCALDFVGIKPVKMSLQHDKLKTCALGFANIIPEKAGERHG